MRTRYLPFEKAFDEESSKWDVVGKDTRGEDFGVGVGDNVEGATLRLRSWVLDSLLAAAADGVDGFEDLHESEPPNEDSISFTPVDLLPVRLRLLRTRQHLSQAQVAERLGMSQQAYAKYERPGANPELKTLVQLERALQAPLLEFA